MNFKISLFATSNNLENQQINKLPNWAIYLIATLLVILGICSFLLYLITKRKAEEYKQKQLKEYKIKYNIHESKKISYEETKMFLPPWETVKLFAPVFGGLVFTFIGVSLFFGWTFNIN